EHQAERVDIARGHNVARVLPDGRGDVTTVEVAPDRIGDAEVGGVRDVSQVEVPQFDDAAWGDNYVPGADVPVEDAVLVRVPQPRRHAFDDPGFLVPGQGLFAVLVEQPLEKLPPLDVADRLDETVVIPGEHVADADKVRMHPQESHGVLGVED